MPDAARTIDTGLTGPVNKEILDSVIGQLSDGKWENSPMMAKYWRNASIEDQDGRIVIIVKDGWDSGFRGKDETSIKAWFAGKIKEIVYDEMDGKRWDRKDTTVLDYIGGHGAQVTVSDAYKAYEILKGRSLKNKYATPEPAAPTTPEPQRESTARRIVNLMLEGGGSREYRDHLKSKVSPDFRIDDIEGLLTADSVHLTKDGNIMVSLDNGIIVLRPDNTWDWSPR